MYYLFILGPQTYWHFYVAYPSIHTLSHSLYRLTPLFCRVSYSPIIATPPTTICRHTQCCFGVAFQRFESRIVHLPYPHPHNHVPSNIVEHNHACPFLLSEFHISLPKIQGNTRIFPRFLYPPFILLELYTWPLSYTPLTQYFGPDWPHTNPFFCYNQLQNFLPLSLYPTLPIYLLKKTLKQFSRRHTYLCSTSSRVFEKCPNKAGDHTWRKRNQHENRKPVPWNMIRLLLLDKCKFTKPLNWK